MGDILYLCTIKMKQMKKIFALAAVALMTAMSIQAQRLRVGEPEGSGIVIKNKLKVVANP